MTDSQDNSSLASAHITFATPPEALSRLFSMLTGAMWVSGAAILVSLLTAFGVALATNSLRESYAERLDQYRAETALEIGGLRSDVSAYKTEARLAEYQSQELRDAMIQHGVPVPPNTFIERRKP